MGRPFGIELEGPVYTCKWCHTHLGLASDLISKEIKPEEGYVAYVFSRLFNTIILTEATSNNFHDVYCVGCGNDIGFYSVRKDPPKTLIHHQNKVQEDFSAVDEGGPYRVLR
ncbi:hypothetical protein Bca52824_030104 [Brassica carinata]|uniref:Yippee domain-containing protein n=1 Tax=Brassica carinata TaxID=52824 RepID=A0A8X7S810_BRACI|nr:hypothetical protein Bca52824_030104 [Brassica carinata]